VKPGFDCVTRTRPEPDVTNPNPVRHLFLKSGLRQGSKLTGRVVICANSGKWWCSKINMTNS